MAATDAFRPGARVRLQPWMDLWMRGATHGDVVRVTHTRVHVQLDKLRLPCRFRPEDLEPVE